jgi:dephospho-CoA kinase
MILALCGVENAGKTTVAKYLVEKYGFIELSFAKCRKDVVALIFNWERRLLEGDTEESKIFRETKDEFWSEEFDRKITPRIILQEMSMTLRQYHEDIWATIVKRKIHDLQQEDPKVNIIISDLRFNNEFQMVKKMNGKVAYVYRCDRIRIPWYDYGVSFALTGDKKSKDELDKLGIHPSSYTFLGFKRDLIIPNNGDITDLYTHIENTLPCYLNKYDMIIVSDYLIITNNPDGHEQHILFIYVYYTSNDNMMIYIFTRSSVYKEHVEYP